MTAGSCIIKFEFLFLRGKKRNSRNSEPIFLRTDWPVGGGYELADLISETQYDLKK